MKRKKIEPESELEKEYKKLFDEVKPQIQAKLDLAVQAMNEAQELADTHGVPFSSPLSFFANDSYIPESFAKVREKFVENSDEEEEDYSYPSDPGLQKLAKIVEVELTHTDRWEGEKYDGWESDGWSYSSMFC